MMYYPGFYRVYLRISFVDIELYLAYCKNNFGGPCQALARMVHASHHHRLEHRNHGLVASETELTRFLEPQNIALCRG